MLRKGLFGVYTPAMTQTVKDIINAIGRKKMASALGVSLPMLSNAVMDGRFPARWLLIMSDLTAEVGIECPLCLFAFRQRADEPDPAISHVQTS
jgi:hypothetical protein